MDVPQFENYTKMIRARLSPAAVDYQGMLIITEGKDNENDKSFSTELFDSVTGQWYTCNDLPQLYSSLHKVINDDMVYLLAELGSLLLKSN